MFNTFAEGKMFYVLRTRYVDIMPVIYCSWTSDDRSTWLFRHEAQPSSLLRSVSTPVFFPPTKQVVLWQILNAMTHLAEIRVSESQNNSQNNSTNITRGRMGQIPVIRCFVSSVNYEKTGTVDSWFTLSHHPPPSSLLSSPIGYLRKCSASPTFLSTFLSGFDSLR